MQTQSDGGGPAPLRRGNGSEITLECRTLSKSFGGVRAVSELSLEFEAGTITALIGPNGAGKTTLFHLIAGALKPDAGEILCRGRRIDGAPPWVIARAGVGRLFQDIRVFGGLSVRENVLTGFHGQLGERPFANFWARARVREQESRHDHEARRWLELVELSEHLEARADSLSHGQQKLLAIARLLAAGADVLLLDEPAAGINPALIDRLLVVIRELASQGKTIVIIEHGMDIVAKVADRVYFLVEGQLAARGSADEVLGDPVVRSTYLGL